MIWKWYMILYHIIILTIWYKRYYLFFWQMIWYDIISKNKWYFQCLPRAQVPKCPRASRASTAGVWRLFSSTVQLWSKLRVTKVARSRKVSCSNSAHMYSLVRRLSAVLMFVCLLLCVPQGRELYWHNITSFNNNSIQTICQVWASIHERSHSHASP
jgi:hypothetical protein